MTIEELENYINKLKQQEVKDLPTKCLIEQLEQRLFSLKKGG